MSDEEAKTGDGFRVIGVLEIDWDAVEAARAAGTYVEITDETVRIAPAPVPDPGTCDWEASGWQQMGATEDEGPVVPGGFRRRPRQPWRASTPPSWPAPSPAPASSPWR